MKIKREIFALPRMARDGFLQSDHPLRHRPALARHRSAHGRYAAAVVAMADGYCGEVASGFVVLAPGQAAPAEDALIGYCKSRLAKYKIPRRIGFVHELPKNMLEKVLKRELIATLSANRE